MADHPFRWLIRFGCRLLRFVFGLSIAGLAPLVVTIIAELQLSSSQMGPCQVGHEQWAHSLPARKSLPSAVGTRPVFIIGMMPAFFSYKRHETHATEVLFAEIIFAVSGHSDQRLQCL